jgi:hypothetical protein
MDRYQLNLQLQQMNSWLDNKQLFNQEAISKPAFSLYSTIAATRPSPPPLTSSSYSKGKEKEIDRQFSLFQDLCKVIQKKSLSLIEIYSN